MTEAQEQKLHKKLNELEDKITSTDYEVEKLTKKLASLTELLQKLPQAKKGGS